MNRQDHELQQLRLPPQSIESEMAVLGGMMLRNDAYEMVADILSAEDFYRRDHQLIFTAITALAEKQRPYDAVTLGEWFDSQGLSEQIAGGAYLVELASTTPSAANIMAYAQIVRDKAVMRRMIEIGTNIVNAGFQPDGRDSVEIISDAEAAVLGINRTALSSSMESGLAGLKRTYMEMDRRRKAGSTMLGMHTSLSELDKLTMGLQDGDLVILAARPSMGKTALMLQMRREAAKRGMRPYTASMEMSAEQVYMRDVAAVANVDLDHVKLPSLASDEEMARIVNAFATMRDWQWWLDDTPSLSVQKLATRIRRAKKQHNIGIAFIDYLQFIDISKMIKHGVVTAIQDVSRTLKSLAKELRIPIVLLSQLNRGLETRTDKRPGMADLRESGAIEQDADVILFVHRQGYFERDWAKDDPRQTVAEIIVGKARNGQTGTVKAQWLGKYQQFNNLAYEDIPDRYAEVEARRGFGSSQGSNHMNRPRTSGLVHNDNEPS